MATNGHFASLGGDSSDKTAYEHGVQVIDENKEFKYAFPLCSAALHSGCMRCRVRDAPWRESKYQVIRVGGFRANIDRAVPTCPSTSVSKMLRQLDSTTTSSPCSAPSQQANPPS